VDRVVIKMEQINIKDTYQINVTHFLFLLIIIRFFIIHFNLFDVHY